MKWLLSNDPVRIASLRFQILRSLGCDKATSRLEYRYRPAADRSFHRCRNPKSKHPERARLHCCLLVPQASAQSPPPASHPQTSPEFAAGPSPRRRSTPPPPNTCPAPPRLGSSPPPG